MKRLFTIFSLIICPIATLLAGQTQLAGYNYSVDTMAMYPVGPGSTYYYLRFSRGTASSAMDVFYLVVDGKNQYVRFEQCLGKDALIGTETITSVANRKTTDKNIYFAAVNGDFFATTGDVGCPTGYTIANNEFVYTPNSTSRRVGAIDENKIARIGTAMKYSAKLVTKDSTIKINHINYTRQGNELVLYNQHNAATTLTNASGTELAIELLPGNAWHTNATLKAKVTNKEVNVGSMRIQAGGAVLSGNGTAATELNKLAVGDTVTIQLALTIDDKKYNIGQCIGSDNYNIILDSGKVVESGYWNENHPRTAFGGSLNGDTLVFCVVDGRTAKSAGCTTQILGALMKFMGCYTATNWDGGGSSHLYVRNLGLMNNGCEATERAVGNGMYVIADMPTADNTVSKIVAYQTICNVPQYGIVAPKFLGFNQYDVLVDKDVQGVTLSCDPSVGEILEDGRFMASTPNGGTLHATKDGMSTDIQVRLIGSAEVAFRLDSIMVDNRNPYMVEITCHIGTETISVLAAALSWQSDNEQICTVNEQGVITGVGNGYAHVIGTLGNFSDTILVHSEIAPVNPLVWDTFIPADGWKIEGSANFNPSFSVLENEQVARINYTYGVARGAYVKITKEVPLYGLPDTLKLTLRTDSKISKMTIGLRPNDQASSHIIATPFANVNSSDWVTYAVPVRGIVENPNDLAIYPMWMEYINFLLDTKNANGDRYIDIQSIELVYKDFISTGLKETKISEMVDNSARKMITSKGVSVIRGGKIYDLTGRQIN